MKNLVRNVESDMIYSDSRRLKQILMNIIGNAIKFTKNGTITVEIDEIQGENLLRFKVTDTGIGIEPKIIKKLG